jgi:glutamate-1-semialdehyde 2,1-aminomutase
MIEARKPLEAFRSPSSASARLYERATHVMPGGNTRITVYHPPYPAYAARGQGAVIVDVEGQQRLDFYNNASALIHGHADPDINLAVMAQLERGVAFGMPTEAEIALAELLTARISSVEHVRFTNSGSEAVMMAIKAARAYTGRPKIAKFEGCYHGSYDFAEAGLATPRHLWDAADPPATPYSSGTPRAVLENVVVLPFNDVSALERLLGRHRHELAGVLLDLMPGQIGLIGASPPFLRRLRELTAEYGIVLIADEIISLRVAPGGMQSLMDVRPDLTAAGKIIGGGFPVGAVGGAAAIMSVFDPRQGVPMVPHHGTFNANPVTMVAGFAAMQKLTPEVYRRINALGDALRAGLSRALEAENVPGQVTGAGSLFRIHMHRRPLSDYRSSVETPEERARREAVYHGLLARGIVVAPVLFGALSTPMGDAEVDAFVDAFRSALGDINEQLSAAPQNGV